MKKNGNIICDYNKVVLNDGVCIVPGYLKVSKTKIVRYTSTDPNNKLDSKKSIGVLRNRIKGDKGENYLTEEVKTIKTGIDKTRHFCNFNCMERFLKEKLDKK